MLIACSGGGDSMALAALAAATREECDCSPAIVHLDHGLRDESGKEAEFVARVARDLRLECQIESLPVRATRQAEGGGMEEVARRLRYAALERLAREGGYRAVLAGQHADDLAETLWLWLIRGTGLRGLDPMPASRPLLPGSEIPLLRPLLAFRREELREYLRERKLRWLEDPSNEDLALRRNRIRHRLLPMLREEFGADPVELARRLGKQAGAAASFLDSELERRLPGHSTGGPLERDALARLPEVLAAWLLAARLRESGEASADAIDRILEMNRGEATGKSLDLPGSLLARFTDRQLFFELRDALPEAPPSLPQALFPGTGLRLPAAGEVFLDSGWRLALRETDRPPDEPIGPLAARFDAAALVQPLRLVNPGEGQRIRPLGGPGGRKLSDLFIDRKIPRPFRERYPLLIDGEGRVLWVPGLARSEFAPVTNETRRCLCLDLRGPS